jgi:ribonucleoside-diphosphate reductase alpha chain
MTSRRRLAARRSAETFEIEAQGLTFTVTTGRYPDGTLGEVFITNHKCGSMAGINAQDAAVVCSIALQHGVPLETIRRALMRDAQGRGSGPLAVALDELEDKP